MPCPFFEPQHAAENRTRVNARLPLIDEYSGVCHARDGQPVPAPLDMQFNCNHGYSRDTCAHFPRAESRSALRYSVVRQSGERLELVCIEEAGYAPVKWHALSYTTATDLLEPATVERCMAAQALAFCRSYLQLSKMLNVKK